MTVLTADSLVNLSSAMGTAKDKATHTQWYVFEQTPDELERVYRASAFARKIVDIPTADMLRRWRAWSADDEIITRIEAAEKKHRLRQVIARAHRFGRLYGSSAIIMGLNTRLGDAALPLDIAKIRPGDLRYLHVDIYPRLRIETYEDDIDSSLFGLPRTYLYTPVVRGANTTQARIHASRVIPFSGMPLPAIAGVSTQGWGDSVLTALNDTLNTAGTATGVIASLLHETKQDIIKTDLSGIGTQEGRDIIMERFQVANNLKSLYNMLLLGQDEDFDRKTINFAGLPDIHTRMLQELAGMADIPATRFLSQAPAGLQATGESDLRNYYDGLQGRQEDELTDPANRLDAVMLPSEGITLNNGAHWYWNSLWQETDQQKAENGLKRAQATKIYDDSGLLPESVLRKALVSQLVEDGTYPALDSAMKEFEAKFGDLDEIGETDPDEEDGTETNVVPLRRAALKDATPRTLYVSRKLKNAADVLDWARSQGIPNLMPASEMHATIAYSRTPLDWMTVGQPWTEEVKVPAGGPRVVEPIGGQGAVALLFASWDLESRHKEIREAGASWDHDGYQAHCTLTWDAGDADLSKVVPYNGPLVFGPEVFEEIDESWQAGVTAAE